MARRIPPKARWFLFAMGLVLISAMLPVRWLGWTSDLAAIVAWPLAPFTDAGTKLVAWLKPSASPLDALTGDSRNAMEQLAIEKDYAEAQLVQARMQIEALEQQVAQLQLASRYSSARRISLVLADIVGHSPNMSLDVVSLNRGSRDGVRSSAIGVHAGVHLIGKVTEVDLLRSLLVPITSPAMRDLMEAVVMPQDDLESPLDQSARVQLAPQKDGSFLAVVDRQFNVSQGDIVRLADARWPEPAQAMIVGYVDAVESIDDQPLRKRLVVRPKYRAHELASVTLKVEVEAERAGDGTP